MKMSHDFAAVHAAAQHCRELSEHSRARGLRPEDRSAMITAWRSDLARALADDLSPLLSGDRLDVTIGAPEPLTGAAALARIGAVAANSLLRLNVGGGQSAETALLSFDFAAAVSLTDRSFGGDGRPAASVPELLPRSAALMVEDAAATIAAAITRVSYGDTPPPAGAATRGGVIIRSESAARLKPFDPDADCVIVTIAIANRQGCEWQATLAITAERMDRLLPGGGGAVPVRSAARGPASGMAEPFAAMPMTLHVVLAEFDLSLTRLQALAPGDQIPLTMARQVPLMVGARVLAHGSIGTADDHMAIRLTRLPAAAEGFAQ